MNRLTGSISLPTRTVHKDEEIVDGRGDLLLIRADDSVDTHVIRDVLNAYPQMIEILRDITTPSIFDKNTKARARKLLTELGEQ